MNILELLKHISSHVVQDYALFKCSHEEYPDLVYKDGRLHYYLNDESHVDTLLELNTNDIIYLISLNFTYSEVKLW